MAVDNGWDCEKLAHESDKTIWADLLGGERFYGP